MREDKANVYVMLLLIVLNGGDMEKCSFHIKKTEYHGKINERS